MRSDDARTCPRFEAYLDAAIDTGWVRAPSTVLSLSERGLFTATDIPIKNGTKVTMAFDLPDAKPVCLYGEVIYRAVKHQRPGIGVKFVPQRATAEATRALESWCRRAAATAATPAVDLSQFSCVSLY